MQPRHIFKQRQRLNVCARIGMRAKKTIQCLLNPQMTVCFKSINPRHCQYLHLTDDLIQKDLTASIHFPSSLVYHPVLHQFFTFFLFLFCIRKV